MTREEIEDKLRRAVERETREYVDFDRRLDSFGYELEIGNVELGDLMLAMEDALDIRIPDVYPADGRTLRDVIELAVAKKVDGGAMKETIEARLKRVVAEQLEIKASEVDLGWQLASLGTDSLHRVEIVTDLEEELEVKIAERVLEDNLTLRDVVRLAEQSGG